MAIYKHENWSDYAFIYTSNMFDYMFLVDPPSQLALGQNKPQKIWRYTKLGDALQELHEMPQDYKAKRFENENYDYGFLENYVT